MTIESTELQKGTETAIGYIPGYQQPFIVAWWSAGITSTVACKMALELYQNVELYYIDIDTAHEDNVRFKADCEKWYGCEIKTLKSKDFNRIRIGICPKDGKPQNVENFVLEKFLKTEEKIIKEVIDKAVQSLQNALL